MNFLVKEFCCAVHLNKLRMSASSTELPVRLGLDLCHCCVRLIQLIKCTVAARRRTDE